MLNSHPLRARVELDGPWWVKQEPDLHDSSLPRRLAGPIGGDWREAPPCTHLQPWLYPDNPYWGAQVREVNDSAWWYRTRFTLPDPMRGDRLRLVFDGADYEAEVWCNGHRLGTHEGGFGRFGFDVTDLVAVEAENELLVKITSPWDPPRRRGLTYVDEVVRGMVKGLYAHGDGLIPPDVNPIGIWRPVWVEVCSQVTVEGATTAIEVDEYDGSVQLSVRLRVHNRTGERFLGVLHLHLAGETFEGVRADKHVNLVVPPGEHVIEELVRVSDPHWWSTWDLGRPDLYRMRCTIFPPSGPALDALETVLGLRQVGLYRSREMMHFYLNGEPFFVRGTTYMGALYLSQLTPERIEADLDRVQECGLNLIRVHVHVAPPELYEACDRRGILIWQDFELNWVHDWSPEFEERAVGLLREMVAQRGNHPSILTWCAHNEPTALPFMDHNLTEHPDRQLYRELVALDPSRPAFLCSGRQEADWTHAGDTHAYIGGAHGGHFMDVYGRETRLVTEFGCEAPLDEATLDETPLLSDRLAHLRDRIGSIQAYQAALIKYQIEWHRRTHLNVCGGYIQFSLVDLYPQVGCGVLDSARRPKAGLAALRAASQPVHVLLEHTADAPVALWVVNDLNRPLLRCMVEWLVEDDRGAVVTRGSAKTDVPQRRAHRVTLLSWRLSPDRRYTISLCLRSGEHVLDENRYEDPFHPPARPRGFPWHFDTHLGMRCYGGPHARSSLRVFNTWYGRIASLLFPVYRWAEGMLDGKPNPRLSALLRRVFG